MNTAKSPQQLQESLAQVTALLERHRVLEELAHRQEAQKPKGQLLEALQHRQNLAELHNRLRGLHPADVAYILEALPTEERRVVFGQVQPDQADEALLEVSPPVRVSLIEGLSRPDLVKLLRQMDADDLAYISEEVDPDVLREVSSSLDQEGASWLREQASHPEGSVGHLMSREFAAVKDVWTVEEVLAELRRRGSLPRQTDELFVVDARNVLRGLLSLPSLLVHDPRKCCSDLMRADYLAFSPEDRARTAAQAFERYDLVSAPVVDQRGKLVGRLTVDGVMDFLSEQAQIEALKRAGLQGEEDLFGPIWDSARNRWPWLAINLVTAFLASRVIGIFESTIEQLVALATLMPIVASVGGNTGNQTVALMIRGLALDQVNQASARHLVTKELLVSLLNGLVWGTVMGAFAHLLYGSLSLSLVMAAAILLNLVVAALVGIAVPLSLARAGRDPAQGSSVLLTFTTDAMGFFIFLGLARAFLIRS